MTCQEFKKLYDKCTTGDGTLLSLTVAERSASVAHYHQCETCAKMVEDQAQEEVAADPPTEEEVAAIDLAVVTLRMSDLEDGEAT